MRRKAEPSTTEKWSLSPDQTTLEINKLFITQVNKALFERIKSVLFSMVALFAEWAYDLVKHDCHFTLLSLCPQGWKLLENKDRM